MIAISHSPILTATFRNAAEMPDKTAVITTDGKEISYSTLQRNILRCANWLYQQGISSGDRIMISAEKDVKFVYLYLAAHLIGAVNVVADADNDSSCLKYMGDIAQPTICIGIESADTRSYLYSEINLSDEMKTDGQLPAYREGNAERISPNSPADIMFTSGTTGIPKGVVLTHANIAGAARNINSFIGNTAEDVELLCLPVSHSFGLGRLRCNLLAGATIVMHDGFANLKSVFNAFEKFRVSGFGMVPAAWAYIRRFSGNFITSYAPLLKYIEIGSAALPREEKQLLCELFPTTRICMHYGLTEASRAAFMELHEDKEHLDSVGKSVNGEVDIRILGKDGREVDRGEMGEICIKGEIVTPGYLDSAQNEDAFFGDYFRTGDEGYRDEEGYLYLTYRIKDIINVGGKKVSPVEIEEEVRNISGAESVCIATADPDGILGEVPSLFILKDSLRMDLEKLKVGLRKRLENYKFPRFFKIVDSLSLSSNGKKKRRADIKLN